MEAPHGPCGRQAYAHRYDVLKAGGRLGPSGLLVAQELEGFGLGAGSGLHVRHLLRRRLVVCRGFLRRRVLWVTKPFRTVRTTRRYASL